MISRIINFFKNLFKSKQPSANKPASVPSSSSGLEVPPWMKIALAEKGVSEMPGRTHNKRILEYHQVTTLKATTDEVPWCASFACWCLKQCGLWNPKSARAKDFATDGFFHRLARPVYGCIVVYSRIGGGHVDFYESGFGTGSIKGLGGNEGNRVADNSMPESSVLGYFWPMDFPLPEGYVLA